MTHTARQHILMLLFIAFVGSVTLTLALWKPAPVLDHTKDPAWFANVQAPDLDTVAEVDRLWQAAPRCCGDDIVHDNQIFYKACAGAIDRNPSDENLVVKCLWLMSDLADTVEQRASLKQTIVTRYASHRDSLENCANCAPGDTVSRAAQELASLNASSNKLNEAIALLEQFLQKRERDTSPWVRIEMLTDLGRLYLRVPMTEPHKTLMKKACAEFSEQKNDETIERRYEAFSAVCQQVAAHH